MYQIKLADTDNRKIAEQKDNITIYEYHHDMSVDPGAAVSAYYAAQMNVRKRQALFALDSSHGVVCQAGAMQWIAGKVEAGTNVNSVGNFAKKLLGASVTGESVVKPLYTGEGQLMLEPTYKHLLIEGVSEWSGMVIDDGLFLACQSTVNLDTVSRKNVSSALAGGEGLFNTCLTGEGLVVLESRYPREELVEVVLEDDELKVDGNFAVCWSASLSFTVERSAKNLIGSAASGEGLVNVYRGTGRVLMAPL
ncbi:MAG: AIM24 family protein [Lachnospira sp.]|nr:AIM24 family protein [Lachnospira sp.]